MSFGVVLIDYQERFCDPGGWNDRTARLSQKFTIAARGEGQDVVEFHFRGDGASWPLRDVPPAENEIYYKCQNGFFAKGEEETRFIQDAKGRGWTHIAYGGCNIEYCVEDTLDGSTALKDFKTAVFVDLISALPHHRINQSKLRTTFKRWQGWGVTLLHSDSYLRYQGLPDLVYGEALSAKDAAKITLQNKRGRKSAINSIFPLHFMG